MMSGQGVVQFSLVKKHKDWTSRALAPPHPPTSDNILFLPLTPHPTPSKWTSFVYHHF